MVLIVHTRWLIASLLLLLGHGANAQPPAPAALYFNVSTGQQFADALAAYMQQGLDTTISVTAPLITLAPSSGVTLAYANQSTFSPGLLKVQGQLADAQAALPGSGGRPVIDFAMLAYLVPPYSQTGQPPGSVLLDGLVLLNLCEGVQTDSVLQLVLSTMIDLPQFPRVAQGVRRTRQTGLYRDCIAYGRPFSATTMLYAAVMPAASGSFPAIQANWTRVYPIPSRVSQLRTDTASVTVSLSASSYQVLNFDVRDLPNPRDALLQAVSAMGLQVYPPQQCQPWGTVFSGARMETDDDVVPLRLSGAAPARVPLPQQLRNVSAASYNRRLFGRLLPMILMVTANDRLADVSRSSSDVLPFAGPILLIGLLDKPTPAVPVRVDLDGSAGLVQLQQLGQLFVQGMPLSAWASIR